MKFDKKDIRKLRELIDQSASVVITAHLSPDGDAMGSSLGLAHVLYSMGKDVKVIVPNMPSHQLRCLPGSEYVEIFSSNEDFFSLQICKADIIFCLDYNDLSRIDRMKQAVASSLAPKVLIDHHLRPDNFAKITISRPESSSTCLLLFQVLCALELIDAIDKDAAQCLLAGMMTDTGNFSYNSNDPEAYEAVAQLLRRGANKDRLSKELFDTFSESCLRLNAYAIAEKMKVWDSKGAALITLTRQELNDFGYQPGDTEGLVNKPLAIKKVTYSAFLREETEYIKVSMRSKGDFPCDVICAEHFNGGGHRNAAGGEFYGTMEQAIETFESIIDENYRKYINK